MIFTHLVMAIRHVIYTSYSVSILLTFGVSLAVGLIVARKNRQIDMVEALKGTE